MMTGADWIARAAQIEAGDDPHLAKVVRDVLVRADELLDAAPLARTLRHGRLAYMAQRCMERVYAFGLAERLTGDSRYAEAAVAALETVCGFADWNPGHFLDTGEMCHAVGVGYDWFGRHMDAAARGRVRDALVTKGLREGLAAYEADVKERFLGPILRGYNWSQVCNSGLIVGALAVLDEAPEVAGPIIRHALAWLPLALAQYAPDGAWPEGPGYWSYGTRYTVYAAAALASAVGTDFGLTAAPGFDRTAAYSVLTVGPTGLMLNVADTPLDARDAPRWERFWLARRFDDPLAAWAEHRLLEDAPARSEHLVWYAPMPGDVPARPLDVRFGGPVEVVCLRGAWDDPEALFLGVQAGFGAVNHGHLDMGQFVLDACGVRWAVDLGKDDYGLPGYWCRRLDSDQRWTYYRMGSRSHNVPLVAGRNQRVGGVARVTEYAAGGGAPRATVDLTSAYLPDARRATREAGLAEGRRTAWVRDAIDLARPLGVTWGMTTAAEIDIAPGGAVLRQDGRRLRVEIDAPAGSEVATASAEKAPPEAANEGYRRLEVRVPPRAGSVCITVRFVPVGGV